MNKFREDGVRTSQERDDQQPLVGILALQGDFHAHARAFQAQGCTTRFIRYPRDLEKIAALVLPGGESTTHLKALQESRLWEAIREKIGEGIPLLATCAGIILAAESVESPEQASLKLLNVKVRRNGWGRQKESFITRVEWSAFPGEQELVFIRAPRILAVGEGVEVLGDLNGEPVLVRQGNRFGATFHPELSARHALISLFVEQISRVPSS